jgi:anti-sigma factor RsiW
VNHWTARRLLASVPDHTLPAPLEAEVRRHAARCRRCHHHLDELAASEALLAKLPSALVPLEPRPGADARLAGLARWAGPPVPTWGERLGVSAAGACAAAALLALVLTSTAAWPPVEPESRGVTLAAVLPETRLLPTGVR